MKHALYALLLLFSLPAMLHARKATTPLTVQPAFWWSGMQQDTLQVLLYGEGIGQREVSLSQSDVKLIETVRPANTNYIILYLALNHAAPQTFDICLKNGRRVERIPYQLRQRNGELKAQGFTSADVLYLLMPDRFSNGNPQNDVVKGLKETTSSQQPDARHGGDLAGMQAALPYLKELGVTAIWPTPLLINDMPNTTYHGYAITDYYRIDPRYGSNEEYCGFVKEAHRQGLKVIQDMVFNHCGSENFLFRDRPDSTWFNNNSRYVQTTYKISSLTDPHVSGADAYNSTDGWFVEVMPDLNQKNPHVMKYLVQNSIWWIEYAGIDGIRQDTYPYADRMAMARWNEAIMKEYPRFNIVGETWINNNVGVSQWQTGSKLVSPDYDSKLKTVMDFPFMNLLGYALDEETNDWDRGLARIYDYLSQDAVYADPDNLLTFLANHDTPRYAQNVAQANKENRYRQALTLLLTVRGIPQLYYGDELAMAADKSKGDGALRQNMPGGFPGDKVNAFTGENLTPLMQRTHDFTKKLLRWRQGSEAAKTGDFRHFTISQGVYVYSRTAKNGRSIVVFMNGTDKPACVDLARYAEVLPKPAATDVISGRTVRLDQGNLQMDVRGTLILEF